MKWGSTVQFREGGGEGLGLGLRSRFDIPSHPYQVVWGPRTRANLEASPESGSGESHLCVRDGRRFVVMLMSISTAVRSGVSCSCVSALPGAVGSLGLKGIPKEP